MTTQVNGDTGCSQVQAGSITQSDLAANVVGNGPAFSAYQSVAQTIANSSMTKLQLQSEEFDTNNFFDSTTNYRFQPTVAGYYQVSGCVNFASAASTILVSVFKNGVEWKRGVQAGAAALSGWASIASALVYMNGSTDYVELFGYQSSGGLLNTSALQSQTYFQGFLVRAA